MQDELRGHTATDKTAAFQPTLLFVRMWALAHIIHLLIANDYALDTPASIAVVALAFMVLLTPRSGPLFAAMALAQLVEYVVEMPFSPDHWAVVAFVNVAVLSSMAMHRSASVHALTRAIPAARVILLVSYAAAALSKWNFTFVDPLASCASALAQAATYGNMPFVSDVPHAAIGTLAAETSIALLLLLPPTRWLGVAIGLAFHFLLSASPAVEVGDFTSTLYALFFLFLHPNTVTRILDSLAAVADRSAIVRDARRMPWLTAVVAFLLLGFGGHASAVVAFALGYVLTQIYLLSLMIAALMAFAHSRDSVVVGRVQLIHLPVLALAVFWALNPYLGLRTTGVNTMFSNLRTEGGSPNHLFMPSIRLTQWQVDLVKLESSNDPQLQYGASRDLSVPLIGLRRMAEDNPYLIVTGTLAGERITFGRGEGQAAWQPLPWWLYKTVLMRPVASDETPFCSIG